MTTRPTRAFLAGPRPLCFAHRGGAAEWPENTLLAFRRAIEAGCDAIETDVHLTRDGQVVVLHDARLERTTSGHGLVSEHTLDEVRRLDAAHWHSPDGQTYPHRDTGLTVPTLAELVELPAGIRLNIDLKPEASSVVQALWRFIDDRGLHDRVLIASKHDRNVRQFRAVSRGRVATSASYREVLLFWGAARLGVSGQLRPGFDALQVPLRHHGLTVVSERLVRAAHAHGVHVHVWTLDDAEAMLRAAELGVDGVMSDRPSRLVRVLGAGRR